jgi:hypothetical protein
MAIRSVVVFHNLARPGSAWCCAEGLVAVLRTMGCDVTDGGNPWTSHFPIEQLERADLVVLGAPEWFAERLVHNYGPRWQRLKAVKAAWYAESFYRDDRNFCFDELRPLFDLHFFPARQDAEEFGGHWLPFGIDPAIFRRRAVATVHDAAFLGTMYPKRVEYIARVGLPIVHLETVAGADARSSFELLADAYASTRIFVNLPALSRLLVTKVTEVMACGSMLLTPSLDHPSAQANMDVFHSGEHLVYYDPQRPEQIGELIHHFLANPAERQAIADRGHDEVHARHTLQARLRVIIEAAEALDRVRRDTWWSRLGGAWRRAAAGGGGAQPRRMV